MSLKNSRLRALFLWPFTASGLLWSPAAAGGTELVYQRWHRLLPRGDLASTLQRRSSASLLVTRANSPPALDDAVALGKYHTSKCRRVKALMGKMLLFFSFFFFAYLITSYLYFHTVNKHIGPSPFGRTEVVHPSPCGDVSSSGSPDSCLGPNRCKRMGRIGASRMNLERVSKHASLLAVCGSCRLQVTSRCPSKTLQCTSSRGKLSWELLTSKSSHPLCSGPCRWCISAFALYRGAHASGSVCQIAQCEFA